MRLDRPVGFMLLFWPCAWGFAIVYGQGPMDNNWLAYLILFWLSKYPYNILHVSISFFLFQGICNLFGMN